MSIELSSIVARLTERPAMPAADRHRVLERRDVRRAVEFEFAFVPWFFVVMAVLFRDQLVVLAVSLGALAAMAALAIAWRRGARRRPHPTAFAIGVIIFMMGTTAATSTGMVGTLMRGMFPVVVIGCAVWMPWSARWHGAFLVAAAASHLVGLLVAPATQSEMVVALLVGWASIVASGLGAMLVRRRHLEMWNQTILLQRQRTSLRLTITDLEAAQGRIRRLEGILPICAACKRIRDGGRWRPVESYVAANSEATFSHGICPECALRLYPADAAELDESAG
jgi:hypothetical protein